MTVEVSVYRKVGRIHNIYGNHQKNIRQMEFRMTSAPTLSLSLGRLVTVNILIINASKVEPNVNVV